MEQKCSKTSKQQCAGHVQARQKRYQDGCAEHCEHMLKAKNCNLGCSQRGCVVNRLISDYNFLLCITHISPSTRYSVTGFHNKGRGRTILPWPLECPHIKLKITPHRRKTARPSVLHSLQTLLPALRPLPKQLPLPSLLPEQPLLPRRKVLPPRSSHGGSHGSS